MCCSLADTVVVAEVAARPIQFRHMVVRIFLYCAPIMWGLAGGIENECLSYHFKPSHSYWLAKQPCL